MRSFARLLTLLFILTAFGRAAEPAPKGWTVIGAASDPAVASLSDEQLIDRLAEAEPGVKGPWNDQLFWPIGGIPRIGHDVPFQSSAAVELARRGLSALPALLAHVTDARPTKLIYAVYPIGPNANWGTAYSDDYDPRDRAHPMDSVNTHARRKADEDGTYTFKVGDLCFVTIGQIVGRDLAVVHSRGEDADMISGFHSRNPGDEFKTIDSPVATPALAAAVRSDWSNLSAAEHLALLRAQVDEPNPPHPHVASGIVRLLYYYPAEGAKIAEQLLRRRLSDDPKPAADGGNATNSWLQAMFLEQLAPFRWDRMSHILLENVRASSQLTDGAVAKLPPNSWEPSVPSLGSDLVLKYAHFLIHHGHDPELKAAITHRLNLIDASLQAPADPSQVTVRFVNAIQAGNCRKLLAELDGSGEPQSPATRPDLVQPAARGNVRLGAAIAQRQSRGVKFAITTIEPPLSEVLLSRVIITQAQDDVGVTLWQEMRPPLAPIAIGRSSDWELEHNAGPMLDTSLSAAAPRAKMLRSVRGWVELVDPARDPNAVVKIEPIGTHFGLPVRDPALAKAGVSITLHDRVSFQSSDRAAARTGPSPEKAAINAGIGADLKLTGGPTMEPGDVALAITDPNQRFLNIEFRDAQGHTLRYNHNGWWHSSSDHDRLDVYRLGPEIPSGTTAVIWLRTNDSMLIAPLDLANVPLSP